jgi:arsenate reductase
MAEGLARALAGEAIDVHSAGSAPKPIHPLAVKVMSEVDIDITQQRSKPLDEFVDQAFDFIITLCDRAKESCPRLPTAQEQIHWRIDDPAAIEGSDIERLVVFRRVRRDLDGRIKLFFLANGIVKGAL